nr:YgjP-like metallopeptidase domain-containing protein [Collinsella urealyticum]
MNLRIRRNGTLAASVPTKTSSERIQQFLNAHLYWIASRLAEQEQKRAALTRAKEQAGSGKFPLWGKLCNLPNHVAPDDEHTIDQIYKQEMGRRLPELARAAERHSGVAATSWSIRTMSSRWGSCTPRLGAIRINARLAAYPPDCLVAVIFHELAHLKEPSHNTRFHEILNAWCAESATTLAQLKRSAWEIAAEQT